MEHRWGKRSLLDVGVTLHPGSGSVAQGRITNLSPSGALVLTDLRVPAFTQMMVEIKSVASSDSPPAMLSAYVVRHAPHGLALEWTEFSPPAVATLLSRPAATLGRNAEQHPNQDSRRRNHALGGGGPFDQRDWR